MLAGTGIGRCPPCAKHNQRQCLANDNQAPHAAEQYFQVAGAVDDTAERRQVVGLLRRAAGQAALIGDYALVNALLAAALRLIDPGEAATLTEVHTARHAALYGLGRRSLVAIFRSQHQVPPAS